MRKCRICGDRKLIKCFPLIKNGRYRKHTCNTCIGKRRYNPEKNSRKIARYRAKNLPQAILHDSRQGDRRRGLENNLDLDFVREILSKNCSYCGESEIRRTMDRMDNKVGHLKTNIVPSCVRCNYARRDMPYLAWLELSSALRSAREKGLFGDWIGSWRKTTTLLWTLRM
jgi:hypothetical protein